jgi:hypothetical protein
VLSKQLLNYPLTFSFSCILAEPEYGLLYILMSSVKTADQSRATAYTDQKTMRKQSPTLTIVSCLPRSRLAEHGPGANYARMQLSALHPMAAVFPLRAIGPHIFMHTELSTARVPRYHFQAPKQDTTPCTRKRAQQHWLVSESMHHCIRTSSEKGYSTLQIARHQAPCVNAGPKLLAGLGLRVLRPRQSESQ